MVGIEAYLDRVCGRLRVDPDVAEDIREEFRDHLEELGECYQAEGVGPQEACERALARFGRSARLHALLDEVHCEEPSWAQRLRGLAVGATVGSLLALTLTPVARLGPVSPLLALSGPAVFVTNGAALGGLIGLAWRARGGLFGGWLLGSFVWLVEAFCGSVIGFAGEASSSHGMLNAVNTILFAPIIGGLFGAAVGLISTALLTFSSRLRLGLR